MAFDGSLVFDTKIDTAGFEEGVSALSSASSLLGITSLTQAFNSLAQAAGGALEGLVNMAQGSSAFSGITSLYGNNLSGSLVGSLNSAVSAMMSSATSDTAAQVGAMVMQTVAGGAATDATLSAAMTSKMTQAQNVAMAASGGFNAVGLQIANGISQGVYSGVSAVTNAVSSVVNSALAAAKSAAQIRSPSRVFDTQVGRMLMMGIEQGVLQSTGDVMQTMSYSMDKIKGAAQKSVSANALNYNAASVAQVMQSHILSANKSNSNLPLLQYAYTQSGTHGAQSGSVTNLYMTVNTHDSLSESELTRQAQNFLTRTRRKLP